MQPTAAHCCTILLYKVKAYGETYRCLKLADISQKFGSVFLVKKKCKAVTKNAQQTDFLPFQLYA